MAVTQIEVFFPYVGYLVLLGNTELVTTVTLACDTTNLITFTDVDVTNG